MEEHPFNRSELGQRVGELAGVKPVEKKREESRVTPSGRWETTSFTNTEDTDMQEQTALVWTVGWLNFVAELGAWGIDREKCQPSQRRWGGDGRVAKWTLHQGVHCLGEVW